MKYARKARKLKCPCGAVVRTGAAKQGKRICLKCHGYYFSWITDGGGAIYTFIKPAPRPPGAHADLIVMDEAGTCKDFVRGRRG
jgi:hypothetical protein